MTKNERMTRITEAVFSSGHPLNGLNLLRKLACTENRPEGGL